MKKTTINYQHEPVCGTRGKKTSIGRNNLATSTMNKHKKRSLKAYRGRMNLVKLEQVWRESQPEEANGLIRHKKKGWKLLKRRIQGVEARRKRLESNET